ncbi:ornithine-acyl[acyl carrier protein] N-acyltransferase [Fodinibius roseus]|uniref:Ornithine-acyl[acyl carrier protein] N-acyltransferase n=1 Tax=Fodinibius roseus TaxID=1194090 RepID=A0A1M5F5P4_9BACT|nr:GNAT family N-acyltransferase [Fodinibius roseus]SHF86698.1 ornithine-acyl[acyl carrier protein] N-acyltransferase [Fodinibius roseus]
MLANDPTSLFISNRYAVRLAKTEEDIRKAQALRYSIFNIELGEGLESSHSNRLDVDRYDAQCDHLLVVDRKTEQIIGTYRMQDYQKARQQHGFYTAEEFTLSELPEEMLSESVEVGRACIHKDHRNGRVLYLLWRGIAEYIKMKSARYLIGCCSINSTDPGEGWAVMDYLVHNNHVHETYTLVPTPVFDCPKRNYDTGETQHEVELPQLFRLYLSLGAKVLSNPALDSSFKTIDYLIIVDITKLDEQTRTLFFK